MPTITRSVARSLWAVLRKAAVGRSDLAPVRFIAGQDGLRTQFLNRTIAVEQHLAGAFADERFTIPLEALSSCEGRDEEPVLLKPVGDGCIEVGWSDGGVPQTAVFDEQESAPEFPSVPIRMSNCDVRLLEAFDAAAQSAEADSGRYAFDCVQLRAETGEIIATDSYHAFVQGGFEFPWKGDVLVPRTRLFSAAELRGKQHYRIGRTKTHLVLQCGCWTVCLAIDGARRFPDVMSVIPAPGTAATRVTLTEPDSEFLLRALDRLPGTDDTPVTLDVGDQLAIRARGDDDAHPTELVLTGSSVTGQALRLGSDRTFLLRAVRLGCRTIELTGPDSPLVCRAEHRTFIWRGLGAEDALAPDPEGVRIESGSPAATEPTPIPVNSSHTRATRTRSTRMSRRPQNENDDAPAAGDNGNHEGPPNGDDAPAGDPLAEAEELKTALRTALASTQRLISALKRQHKQRRLVELTLATLKQLQDVG